MSLPGSTGVDGQGESSTDDPLTAPQAGKLSPSTQPCNIANDMPSSHHLIISMCSALLFRDCLQNMF